MLRIWDICVFGPRKKEFLELPAVKMFFGCIASFHCVCGLLLPWLKSFRFFAWSIMTCQDRVWYLLNSRNRLAGGDELNDMRKGRRIRGFSRVIRAWSRARGVTRRNCTGRFIRCTWLLACVFGWLFVSRIRSFPGLIGLKVKWWWKFFFPNMTNIKI